MFILDTTVVSAAHRPDRAPQLAAWLADKAEADLFISVITLAEIERDIQRQQRGNPGIAADLRDWLDRSLLIFSDRLLPFGAEDARIWARLSQQIGHDRAGLMIAATALHHGATVVTDKMADFAPTGVALVNPFARPGALSG
ncbi:MAG: type II toxin-antitoxin system VapC family toxin [Paracoccus sp. (in: a-proteobacteria)]